MRDEVASQRIMKDERITDQFHSPQEAFEMVKMRNQKDQERYLKLYGIDLWNPEHYSFIIDTSDKTPEQVLHLILEAFKLFCTEKKEK